ncbi:MAG: hypothetical protein P8R37_07015 [Opitutae bacterium]|nr:hypothetical protein [Opitutae bacterium]MDG1301322.1 hypothetical protein [Opitutae bacterium]
MRSSYTNTKRKHVHSSKTSKSRIRLNRLIYLGTISLSIAAIATIASFIRAGDDAVVGVELPYGTLVELTEPEVFMQAYLSVNCNPTLLEHTQTIRVTGHMVNGDLKQAFSLIKKRPDRMLFTIDRGSHQVTFGVSGDTVWRRTRAPQHEDIFALVEGQEARTWLAHRRFFDPIISASQGEGSLTAIKAADWKGADCLKVSTLDADGAIVDILIDPQTMYPIAELELLADGTIKQIVFSDYRDINGMPIPFNMVSSKGHIQLNRAALNTGVLSKLFNVPEALLASE